MRMNEIFRQNQLDLLIRFAKEIKLLCHANQPAFAEIKERAREQNAWFDSREIDRMINLVIANYLDEGKLMKWFSMYDFNHIKEYTQIGIVAAGNIPLASFQDVWCALACKCKVRLKLSSKDTVLSKYVYDAINSCLPDQDCAIEYVDQISEISALLASGSNITANHFVKMKTQFPCLVRGHRNGVAVLSGQESDEDLIQLGHDLYSFYGLGCRNVTKVYIPDLSMIHRMAKVFDTHFGYVRDNHKYNNNYEYQLAVLSLNQAKYFQSETIFFSDNSAIHSAIAVLHYQIYSSLDHVIEELEAQTDSTQCICTNIENVFRKKSGLGKSQWPELWDYQDDIDVIHFLQNGK